MDLAVQFFFQLGQTSEQGSVSVADFGRRSEIVNQCHRRQQSRVGFRLFLLRISGFQLFKNRLDRDPLDGAEPE